MNDDNGKFSSWCIVEIFGNQKIAGRVSEHVIAGHGFIRVDVPDTEGQPAFTRLFGPTAIYSMTPVSEDIARAAVDAIRSRPVTVYIGTSRQIEAPADGEDDLEDEEDDRDPFESQD
jgi:hypothetical protein